MNLTKAPQSTGKKFNKEDLLETRKITKAIVNQVAEKVEVGMSEQDGCDLIDKALKDYDLQRCWHPHKFRIGPNTIKSFSQKSDPNVRLKENDIFFIDIGPVINDHEGDFGDTFFIGDRPEYRKIKEDVFKVFQKTFEIWKTQRIQGDQLYDKASVVASQYGYELCNRMSGHRIGDFPHALHYKGSLKDFQEVPLENLWVLEILIRHPSQAYGAFYEDIIY
jgi:Xaa-Pro aminopeptidase